MVSLFEDGYRGTYRSVLAERKLVDVNIQLKSLRDLCLTCIGDNLHGNIIRSGQYIAPIHKELILERLGFHDRFTEEYLPHVTYNLFTPLLERLNLYKCDQVNDAWLKQLAAAECRLKYLTIHDCRVVTDVGIKYITLEQNELRELELRKLSITKKGVVNIISPELVRVDFRGCNAMCNHGVQTLVKNNPTMKYFNLSGCKLLSGPAFSSIAEYLSTTLEYLNLKGVLNLTDECFLPIAKQCTRLKGLNLHGCRNLSAISMNALKEHCLYLEFLDVCFCANLVNETNTIVDNFPSSIGELSMSGLQFDQTPPLVSGIASLSHLTKLELCGVPTVDDDCLTQLMETLGNRLTHFNISGSIMNCISDRGVESIATHCTKLELLGLSLLKNVTGATLLPLLNDMTRASLLQTLLISFRELDTNVITAISDNCYNMEYLDLSRSMVDDDMLASIATTCTQLKHINLKACKKISDAGVRSLARHCPLCVLVLSGVPQLTDKSIIALAQHCPYLEELYISGCTNISEISINHLKAVCVPKLYVAHKLPSQFLPGS